MNIPQSDLVISPPRPEGEKEKDDDVVVIADEWALHEPSTNPVDLWGFDDRDHPSIGTALVA